MLCEFCVHRSKSLEEYKAHRKYDKKCLELKENLRFILCEICENDIFTDPDEYLKHERICKKNNPKNIWQMRLDDIIKDKRKHAEKMRDYLFKQRDIWETPFEYSYETPELFKNIKFKGPWENYGGDTDLLSINVDNCIPLTKEYIQDRFKNGCYTDKMYKNTIQGILDLVISLIKFDNQYSCICTIKPRMFYTLVKVCGSNEWKPDFGAVFVPLIKILKRRVEKKHTKFINYFNKNCNNRLKINRYQEIYKENLEIVSATNFFNLRNRIIDHISTLSSY